MDATDTAEAGDIKDNAALPVVNPSAKQETAIGAKWLPAEETRDCLLSALSTKDAAESKSTVSPSGAPGESATTVAVDETLGEIYGRTNSPATSCDSLTITSLERLRSSASSELMDKGIAVGLRMLGALEDALHEVKDSSEATQWLTELASLQDMVKKTRTVVGVLGNTGAGKSSLINAVLDQESLVTTNCMHACTAVPTEISYNHDPDPQHSYRAEVEFISQEDWTKEVNVLLPDLIDTGKLSNDYLQPNTDAGIAYAKIKAVFPRVTKEMLVNSEVKDLAEDPSLQELLGTTVSLNYGTADDLKAVLQTYLDSAEKTPAMGRGSQKMAYWPLIKTVRVYLKATALSTGTVLVDLPGVQDANAARAAVGERYLAECSSLWIVSPITRAVDDKAAKQLLGTSFRQQMTMDGNYCNITFICSKTDDISIVEVAETLDVNGSIHAVWEEEENMKSHLAHLKSEKRKLDQRKEELEDALEGSDEEDAEKDAVEQSSKKRKFGALLGDVGAEDLSEADATKLLQAETKEIKHTLKRFQKEIVQANNQLKDLETEGKARCIEARNCYSTDSIRQDFADGIRETIAEAGTLSEEAFPGGVDRDYNELAKSLTVFCISSRGYQSLRGRSGKEGIVGGYRGIEDTQIPQLQEHATKLGGMELSRARKAFFAGLARLVRSLALWARQEDLRSSVRDGNTMKDKVALKETVNRLSDRLQQDLDSCTQEAIEDIKNTVQGRLLEPVKSICSTVAPKLPVAAASWRYKDGNKVSYSTYRAMCRYKGRGGSKRARELQLDFNADLYSPLKQNIAALWGHFFSHHLQEGLRIYTLCICEVLRTLQQVVEQTSELDDHRPGTATILKDYIDTRIEATQLLQTQLSAIVKCQQRGANRFFVQSIGESMKEIYAECAVMEGDGCLFRMQETMEGYVEDNSESILLTSLENVGRKLDELCLSLQSTMRDAVGEISANFKMIVNLVMLTGDWNTTNRSIPISHLLAKDEVCNILQHASAEFETIFQPEDTAN